MALHTDDILIDDTDDWVKIPLLDGGTFVQIAYIEGTAAIKARIGADSTSTGIIMKSDDQLKANEPIYIHSYSGYKIVVVVIRDGD